MFIRGISECVYDSYLCAILLCLTAELLGRDPVADFQTVMLFQCFLKAAISGLGSFTDLRTNASHTMMTDTCAGSPAGCHYFFLLLK